MHLIDVWHPTGGEGRPLDIRVSPAAYQHILNDLHVRGLIPEILIQDVQVAYDNQLASNRQSLTAGFAYDKYHRLDEINDWIVNITGEYKHLATPFVITKSFEEREIHAIKISAPGNTDDDSSRPAIFIEGGIHAREWISPATVIYMTNQLLSGYANNSDIKEILNTFTWYILPVFNVDGYEFTWSKDRMWRKTRSRHGVCLGVDPNRNWDYEWGKHGGSSPNPCSETYRGPKPFSEPSVRGVAEYIQEIKEPVRGFIDFHSFSQLWMTPWGYTHDQPKDFKQQDQSSVSAVKALESVSGTSYEHGTIANTIYVADGNSVDWVYGKLGVKYSAAVELRDRGEYGFLLPANQIVPCGNETLQALLAFAKFIKNNP
ncbi:carboxypeptidase B-like [Gigantopelta aegis]|uniref:carboxypeptidase B-like n=1 Tax=Gigantopelta aegis TaxID=1735272 RepID=UPI001B88D53E|nr:carboxypeptidase B-like [Gigantopelta aegis]